MDSFALAGTINGKKYYRHVCPNCYYLQKDEYRQNRKNEFYDWKKTLTCNRCGFKDYRALQFHHTNSSDKTSNIGQLVGRGITLKRIQEEASKCEILCANCHQIEHFYGV